MNKIFCLAVALISLLGGYAQQPNKLEIPLLKQNEKVIHHTGYAFSYNELHEQANWVAYQLTASETNSVISRSDKFRVDPAVKTGTAENKDYAASGYDRGHLAPAADMGWSATTMSESFYYSNMSPQLPTFNRSVWKRAESLVRTWAATYDSLYIVTGPVLSSGLKSIGRNKVSVPNYYYKVILDNKKGQRKSIAFIIRNESSEEPLQQFVVSVDKVENMTGIDFFPLLPDDLENKLESSANLNAWIWENSSSTSSVGNSDTETTQLNQCKGKTKKGTRCKNKTNNKSGYCYLHE